MNTRLISIFAIASVFIFTVSAQAKHHRSTPHRNTVSVQPCVPDNSGRTVCLGAGTGLRQAASHSAKASQAAQVAPGGGESIRQASYAVPGGGTGGLTPINCGGVSIRVASSAASKFEGFCSDMVAAGYPAKRNQIGGYRPHGSCRGCNMHPRGLAIDYDQVSRDRVSIRMSRAEVSRIAARHGLVSGGDWCHGDLGHFEVDIGINAPSCGSSQVYAARKHHRRIRYARR